MQIFSCPDCRQPVFFRNLSCACGTEIAFNSESGTFVRADTPCSNRAEIGCNWTAPGRDLCQSCAMTEVIPDKFKTEHQRLWADAEDAKRWVLANLARWGWFTSEDPGPPPRFHLLAEETRAGPAMVIMGHDEGLITINVMESDPVERTQRREDMAERLRTMIGHFRHEIAHYLFIRLGEKKGFETSFRTLMGDERADYGAALEAYYANGPAPGWETAHVTRYAASHPHEDWAETTAHIMHLTDIVDSAVSTGLKTRTLSNNRYDAYRETDSAALISAGAELGISLNQVNRSMGLQDLYPFVLTPAMREKLMFAHKRISTHIKSKGRRTRTRRFGGKMF